MTDVVTDCDDCHADIAYGETCYAVGTGEQNEEGRPFVRIVCAECRDRSQQTARSNGGTDA